MDVSVIIPALNAEKTVARAIRSALGQTLQTIEVIVVDDGSSDQTAAIVSELAKHDGRVRLISHSRRQGVSSSRNDAIASAKGEWIAVLDADDWYGPLRLDQLLNHARKHNLDGVIDNLTKVNASTNQILGTAFPTHWLSAEEPISVFTPMLLDIPHHNDGMGFGYCKPMFNRSVFCEAVGGYDKRFRCGEDILVLQQFLLSGARVGTIQSSEYFYSIDPYSHSNGAGVNENISDINRLIAKQAKRQKFEWILPLLKDRQVIIDYDALTKAVRQHRIIESILFIRRVPLRILADQVFRIVCRKLGKDYSMLDPRDRKWLKPFARSE